MSRPHVKNDEMRSEAIAQLRTQLDEQLFLGYKVELEALQSLGFDFLSNEWLAERIDARDYI